MAVHRLTGKIGVISDIGSPAPGFTPVNILIYKSKIPKCLLRDKASLMYEQSMESAEAYCNDGGGAGCQRQKGPAAPSQSGMIGPK